VAISDRIVVHYASPPAIVSALTTHRNYLRRELLAECIQSVKYAEGAMRFKLSGCEGPWRLIESYQHTRPKFPKGIDWEWRRRRRHQASAGGSGYGP
jgi:hypothetical protein